MADLVRPHHPLLGYVVDYNPIRDMETGFRKFDSPLGIHGLVQVRGLELHLLAVFAREPGTGQFGNFIRAAKGYFTLIGVWELINPEIIPILQHYNFSPATGKMHTGEEVKGAAWSSEMEARRVQN